MTGPAVRIAVRPQPEGDPVSFVVMGWGGPGGFTPYGLARRSLGSQVLWLFGVSASAPMTVLAGGTVATFAATGVIAVPLSFPLLAVVLGLFAIGYTRLARDVPHAATFAALLTHGLGRTVGAAAAFVAVLRAARGDARRAAGRPVVGVGARRVDGGGGDRLSGVTLGAPVVAVVLTLELGMIVLFDVVALTHPAQTDAGAWLQPWSPDLLAVDGVGEVIAFGVAAFLGFETTAAFGEEVRSDRSVGRATGMCLAFLGIFYGISAWALAVAVGPDHIVDAARDPGSGIPFSVLATGLGPFGPLAVTAGVTLLAGSVLGAMIAFHQVVARYVYALGRERVVPRALAFVSSPHDNSLRTGRRHRLASPGQYTPQRRRRGRSGGVPIGGSATPVRVGAGVIVAAGLLGLDPIATVFTELVTLSALGLLTLMTDTCVAVIGYYRSPERTSQDRPTWWIRCGAPALGGLALAAALAVTVANLGPTLADPSGVAPFLLPLLVVAAAVAGGSEPVGCATRTRGSGWAAVAPPRSRCATSVADLEL